VCEGRACRRANTSKDTPSFNPVRLLDVSGVARRRRSLDHEGPAVGRCTAPSRSRGPGIEEVVARSPAYLAQSSVLTRCVVETEGQRRLIISVTNRRKRGLGMAFDTFIVYVGVYADVEAAEADYELIKDLHTEAGLIDAYDAAVIQRRDDGKVKIARKHETPTRVGGVLGGGVGLATGLVVALFPFAAIGGGLLAATAAGGTALGALAGHAAAGMSRDDLKELGESLDAGQAGLVVVGASDMEAKIEREMRRSEKVQKKQLKADLEEIERDAKTSASAGE
jgi:uncharacterized membrane protein